MNHWEFNELDSAIASELAGRLPARIFDAHAHLYRMDQLTGFGSMLAKGPGVIDPPNWREILGRQVGSQRLAGALFIPMPLVPPEKLEACNTWIMEQTTGLSGSKALVLLSPGMTREQVKPLLSQPHFAGFKPYHTYSLTSPTFDSPPGDYIPDWAWEMANENSLAIVIHLVKDRALADPKNISYLREHCLAYPGAKVILAHGGRSFHAPNALKGVKALADLTNIWYDSSGVCESEPLKAVLDTVGPWRLLWGSDFPISETRGRCVTAGDGFIWITPETINMENVSPACQLLPVGVECLRALFNAVDDLGLNEYDIENIFRGNAEKLLGLTPETENLTQERYLHAKTIIPGGTQLLSKRPEMFAPNQWPPYFREAHGCETWDLDGRHYYDFSSNGIGACLLGFQDPDVSNAVRRRVSLGSMSTLNPPEEVELADQLLGIHPWSEQVRFARCGGEICAVAVRIARATTDRSIIAICGYSGWQDWYLAANLGADDALRGHLLPGLSPLGVPRELRGSTVTFGADNCEEFQSVIDKYGDRLAAVVMEPCRSEDPAPGFLEFVRDGARRSGALLIFDEITIGWRLNFGGSHLKFGVSPDMAVYAKALGNGHPMAAVLGTREAMAGAHGSFISSTYWTESVGPTAALATLRKMQKVNVPSHIERVGSKVQSLWAKYGQKHNLPVHVSGYPCLAHFHFEHEQADALRTLYTQYMLDRGFLAGAALYPTMAHTDDVIELYGKAIDEVFGLIADAISKGNIADRLRGPVAHSGFRRLTN